MALKYCQRPGCHGTIIEESGEERCNLCGRSPVPEPGAGPVPAAWGRPARQRRQVHREHATRRSPVKCPQCRSYRTRYSEVWCVSKHCPSHYPRDLRPRYHYLSYEGPAPPPGDHPGKADAPGLPAWNESWVGGVRVAWLEAYHTVHIKVVEILVINCTQVK